MTIRHRIHRLSTLVTWLCVAGGFVPAIAQDGQDAGEAQPRVAIAVFLDITGAELPGDARDVRLAAGKLLSGALADRGVGVCDPVTVFESMQRWRIRSGTNLQAGFLSELEGDCDIERLLVAQLIFFPESFVFACRAVHTATGEVAWVEIVEGTIGYDWRSSIASAAEKLGALWRAPRISSAEGALILMPPGGVGANPAQRSLYGFCALRSLSRAGAWRLPDPGFVEAALRDQGLRVESMGAEARRFVAESFGSSRRAPREHGA